MSNIHKVLVTIVAAIAIVTAFYKFDVCKVDKKAYAKRVAMVDVQLLEIYRKNLVQKIWAIEREFPNTYKTRQDHRALIEELRLLDLKIQALYKGK